VVTKWGQLHPKQSSGGKQRKNLKGKPPAKKQQLEDDSPVKMQQNKVVGYGLQLINTILPALDEGAIVLCDGYYFRSIARAVVRQVSRSCIAANQYLDFGS